MWYYEMDGAAQGPVSESKILDLIDQGVVTRQTLVWQDGMADWVPAAQTDLIASAGPPPVRSQQAAGWDPEPEQTYAGPVDNHLVKAILVTIFCCLPLGIVSIVYAAQVNGHVQAGRRAEALEASANASKWANWGLIAGLVIGVLYILYLVVIIGFAGMGALDSY